MMNPSLQGHNKRHLRHVGAFLVIQSCFHLQYAVTMLIVVEGAKTSAGGRDKEDPAT